MVVIEYNAAKIYVPESWDDITLGTYEAFYRQKPTSHRERVVQVAVACNIDADVFFNAPKDLFNAVLPFIDFIFKDNPYAPTPEVQVDGAIYIVPIQDELSLGAWVDAEQAQKDGVEVLANVLAIVCRPPGEEYDYKNNEARREMFSNLPVSKVLGVLAFFLRYSGQLERRTQLYSNLCAVADRLHRNIKSFLRAGAGIKPYQIWRVLKFYSLTVLLRYRLQKYSRSYNTKGRKIAPKMRSAN